MDSWSGNCPFDPLPLPLPFHVDTWAGLEDHVRPPSLERLANRGIWKGGVRLKAWEREEAVAPGGEKPTARGAATAGAPLAGSGGGGGGLRARGERDSGPNRDGLHDYVAHCITPGGRDAPNMPATARSARGRKRKRKVQSGGDCTQ